MDDVDPVAELLALQERMQVVEQELQVMLSVAVGDDDGRLVSGLAFGRPVAPPSYHQGVFPLNLGQSESRREADVDRPACGQTQVNGADPKRTILQAGFSSAAGSEEPNILGSSRSAAVLSDQHSRGHYYPFIPLVLFSAGVFPFSHVQTKRFKVRWPNCNIESN